MKITQFEQIINDMISRMKVGRSRWSDFEDKVIEQYIQILQYGILKQDNTFIGNILVKWMILDMRSVPERNYRCILQMGLFRRKILLRHMR